MRALALIFVVACGSGSNDTELDGEYPPSLPLDAEYTLCDVDGDCRLIELGCCDACNGGMQVEVNADSVDEVKARFSEQCRGGVDCSLMACSLGDPVCIDGTCGTVMGSY